jgi:hypothetical protein
LESTTGITIPQGMTFHDLPAGEYRLQFWGRFLDEVDTDNGKRPRWAQLSLYRIIDDNPEHVDSWEFDDGNRGMYGREMWLLYTTGHTLLYHDIDCHQGVKVTKRDILGLGEDSVLNIEDPDDLEPAEDCRPRDWHLAELDDEFRLETTWHSDVPCQTPAKVREALSKCGNCHDKPHQGACYKCGCANYRGVLTSPGSKLWDQVCKLDPDLAGEAATRVRRL